MQNNRLKLLEITKDGSPTLRMNGNQHDPLYTEQMHYSTGAASETIYIYGEAIKRASELLRSDQTNYLVVGLGLGYVEILICLISGGEFRHIHSFEKDQALIDDFKNWCHQPGFDLYDQVTQSLLNQLKFNISIDEIKTKLKNKLRIDQPLESPINTTEQKFNVICYDAFSRLMDQKLWDEEFLTQFIKQYSADICIFASYSKTGALSRALKKNGFTFIHRKGFSTKRECTLAIRI
jgi:hypothetical protein